MISYYSRLCYTSISPTKGVAEKGHKDEASGLAVPPSAGCCRCLSAGQPEAAELTYPTSVLPPRAGLTGTTDPTNVKEGLLYNMRIRQEYVCSLWEKYIPGHSLDVRRIHARRSLAGKLPSPPAQGGSHSPRSAASAPNLSPSSFRGPASRRRHGGQRLEAVAPASLRWDRRSLRPRLRSRRSGGPPRPGGKSRGCRSWSGWRRDPGEARPPHGAAEPWVANQGARRRQRGEASAARRGAPSPALGVGPGGSARRAPRGSPGETLRLIGTLVKASWREAHSWAPKRGFARSELRGEGGRGRTARVSRESSNGPSHRGDLPRSDLRLCCSPQGSAQAPRQRPSAKFLEVGARVCGAAAERRAPAPKHCPTSAGRGAGRPRGEALRRLDHGARAGRRLAGRAGVYHLMCCP